MSTVRSPLRNRRHRYHTPPCCEVLTGCGESVIGFMEPDGLSLTSLSVPKDRPPKLTVASASGSIRATVHLVSEGLFVIAIPPQEWQRWRLPGVHEQVLWEPPHADGAEADEGVDVNLTP
jgi:hypothetical protein